MLNLCASYADQILLKEIERIKGLSVSTEFSPRGQALFSNEHFAANGSFNINKVRSHAPPLTGIS